MKGKLIQVRSADFTYVVDAKRSCMSHAQ